MYTILGAQPLTCPPDGSVGVNAKDIAAMAAALAAVAGLPAPAAAAKTDLIALGNGDRITCEITDLGHGRMRAATDDMGTLDTEWDMVDSLRADSTFEIGDDTGIPCQGAPRGGPRSGAPTVEAEAGVRVLDMVAVVRISRPGSA